MLSKECHEQTTFSMSDQAPRPPDRRGAPRHFTILRVGALIGPAGRDLCLIRNISAGGLLAHVYSNHAVDERVTVELKTDQPVSGRVLWADESNVGIEFDEPIDVADMLASQAVLANGWRSRMPRVEVDRLATLRCGARLYGVNTRDISQGGVKIEVDQPLVTGAEVVLTPERFRPIQGVVRWCQDDCAGIAFNHLLPFHELMDWLHLKQPRLAD